MKLQKARLTFYVRGYPLQFYSLLSSLPAQIRNWSHEYMPGLSETVGGPKNVRSICSIAPDNLCKPITVIITGACYLRIFVTMNTRFCVA